MPVPDADLAARNFRPIGRNLMIEMQISYSMMQV